MPIYEIVCDACSYAGETIAPGATGTIPLGITVPQTGKCFLKVNYHLSQPACLVPAGHLLGFARAHEAGIRAALHCGTSAYAAKAIGWGFDLVTLLNDVRLLAGAAKASIDQARQLMGEQVSAEKTPKNQGY